MIFTKDNFEEEVIYNYIDKKGMNNGTLVNVENEVISGEEEEFAE